jgi:hypothetical protein
VEDLKKLLATPRGKVLAVVLAVLLVGAAFMAMSSLGGPSSGSGAVPPVAPLHPHRTAAAAYHAPATKKTAPVVAHTAKVVAPVAKPQNPAISSTIPAALGAKLIDNEVVVVQIYNPGSAVDPVIDDAEAYAEAKAGAQEAGVGFAAINVNNQAEMNLVAGLVDVSADPFVFIMNRSGKILFERTGYIDRGTIAQAATNALIGTDAQDTQPIGPKDGIAGPYDGYWKARADQVFCAAQDAIKTGVPKSSGSIASTIEVLRIDLSVGSQVIQQLRAIPAVGPDRGTFLSMVDAYAKTQGDIQAAIAALQRTPPSLRRLHAALDKAASDANGWIGLETKIGISCFQTDSGSSSGSSSSSTGSK